jgi:hypothetical protein
VRIAGKWRIAEMDEWDREDFDLMGPAFFSFDALGSGSFRFIAVRGWMDCRHGEREGRPFVEFTWDGNDELHPASGRGWARIEDDGTLSGHIFIHRGDDSGFKTVRAEAESRPGARRSRDGRRARRSVR